MAHIVRSLLLALAAGAAGGAAATLLNRDSGDKRSLAKGAVRSGLLMFDRVRGAVGEMSETMTDVVAEVQSELEEERGGAGPHHREDAQKAGGGRVESESAGAREHVAPFGAKTAQEAERTAHG